MTAITSASSSRLLAAADLPELTCPPRFSTPRNLDRPTLGHKVAAVAEQLGTPLMPWQRFVADVILEIDPATGLLFYREWDLLVPRQSGKTTLILAKAVHRALGWDRAQNIMYAAQTRNDARKKWEDDHVEALNESPFGKMRPKPYRVRKANGQEAIIWRNGSMHGIVAPTEKGGHGSTLDEGFIDEAFAQQDGRLEQAMKPAMITRDEAQLGVVSTAGRTPGSSPYLWGKVEAGRARCAEGYHPRIAYFEWSASDEMDRADIRTWQATMPALGITQPLASVAAEFESMPPAEFDRAFLCRWNPAAVDAIIPADAWTAAGVSLGMVEPVTLAIDVTPDGAFSAICSAGASLNDPNRTAFEVVDHRAGTDWLVARLAQVIAKIRTDRGARAVNCVLLDKAGPAGLLIPALAEAGIVTLSPTDRVPRGKTRLVEISTADHIRSCGAFLEAIKDGTAIHPGAVSLNIAAGSASRRTVNDGWLFSRRSSSVDICPLVAAELAHWGHLTVKPAKKEPHLW